MKAKMNKKKILGWVIALNLVASVAAASAHAESQLGPQATTSCGGVNTNTTGSTGTTTTTSTATAPSGGATVINGSH